MSNNKFATINFFIESLCFLRNKTESHVHQARIKTYGLTYAERIIKIRTMTKAQLIVEITDLKEQCKRCENINYGTMKYEYQSLLVYANNRRFILKKGEKK